MFDKALSWKHSYLFGFWFKISFKCSLMLIRKKLKAFQIKGTERKAIQLSNIPVVRYPINLHFSEGLKL